MGILRKKQKEMLEVKNIVTEVKNAFDELIFRLDTAEERISELENISLKNLQNRKVNRTKTEKKKKKQNRIE